MKNITHYFEKKYFVPAALVILFLAVRLPVLLTEVKHIEMNEETVCGFLTNDIIDSHIRLPILDYQNVEWCGDTLLVGFLSIPFFFDFWKFHYILKTCPSLFFIGDTHYMVSFFK